MSEIKLKIDGMNCQHCIKAIETELMEASFEILEIEIGSVKVKYDGTDAEKIKVIELIKEAGYRVI